MKEKFNFEDVAKEIEEYWPNAPPYLDPLTAVYVLLQKIKLQDAEINQLWAKINEMEND